TNVAVLNLEGSVQAGQLRDTIGASYSSKTTQVPGCSCVKVNVSRSYVKSGSVGSRSTNYTSSNPTSSGASVVTAVSAQFQTIGRQSRITSDAQRQGVSTSKVELGTSFFTRLFAGSDATSGHCAT